MVHLITSILIFNGIAFIMPKKLLKIEMYATSVFSFALQMVADVFLSFKYDMYGYFRKGPDFTALLPIAGIYPAITVLFLNYFPFGKRL